MKFPLIKYIVCIIREMNKNLILSVLQPNKINFYWLFFNNLMKNLSVYSPRTLENLIKKNRYVKIYETLPMKHIFLHSLIIILCTYYYSRKNKN